MSSCSICCECFPSHPLSHLHRNKTVLQPCCQGVICQTCLHSHILSIFSEGITGETKRALTCPLGCATELTDGQVRLCIHNFNLTLARAVFGPLLYNLWIPVMMALFTGGLYDNYRYNKWMNLTKTVQERRELLVYEKWSLSVALAKRIRVKASSSKHIETETNANSHYVHVIRCPRPNCECIWLSSHPYRTRKLKNERKYSSSNGATSMLKSASTWLFYAPPKLASESVIAEAHGYTIDHWLDAIDVNLFERTADKSNSSSFRLRNSLFNHGNQQTRKSEGAAILRQLHRDGGVQDGRRVTCPNCSMTFCALCTRAWSTVSKASPWSSVSQKRISHTNKSCAAYCRKAVSVTEDDFATTADALDARMCPGCSMRTSRISGCNHMTCACGVEWCFVCECRWNPSHYSCYDVSSSESSLHRFDRCIVS